MAVFLAVLAAPADAQAFLYAGKRKRINCGVVVAHNVDGSACNQPLGSGMDASGYPTAGGGVGDLFYLLEMRTDMKPPGWSFDNPLAPGGPATGLTKAGPVYWQVDLQSGPDLSRMHVLYFPASGTVTLTSQERETLRKFVDGGGVLWIDNGGGSGGHLDFGSPANPDDPGTFFILNFKFKDVTDGWDFPISRHHPLLTLPFWLNDWDIANLGWKPATESGAKPGSAVCIPGYDPGGTGGWGAITDQPVSFDVLYPVVGNTKGSGRPSMAANAYGSGRVVATSTYVGRGCYFGSASLKFAYNVISWSSSWTHLRKDPRHSGASIDTVGGTKLLEIWSLPVPASGGGAGATVDSAPVIYKNVVFYTSGSKLYALDLFPQEDLDHDGNPDDGFQGLNGMPNNGQDIVWSFLSPDGGKLSAPSIVTAQDPKNPNASVEAVLVASDKGTVYMLSAFAADSVTGALLPEPILILDPPWPIPSANPNPGPPLYANGWIYATGGDGRIYAYNPSIEAWVGAKTGRTGDFKWEVPSLDSSITLEEALARTGPNFGYVVSASGGGTVGMVYWFTTAWQHPKVEGQERNDTVCGVPVHVGNDRVGFELGGTSDHKIAQYHITYQAMVSSVPKPYAFIRKSDGTDELAEVVENSILQGDTPVPQHINDKGHIVVKSKVTDLDATTVVHATYALDYVSAEGSRGFPARAKQSLQPSSTSLNNAPITTVASMPAMGPDNMIFLAGQRGSDAPPAIYGLSNDGTTQYSRWIYLLHGAVNPELLAGHLGPSMPDMPIPGVVYDVGTGASIDSPKVFSSPAVWGDKVFVTVSGTVPTDPDYPTPSAALLCFKANSNFVIRITENAGYAAAGGMLKKSKRLRDPVTGAQKHVMLWQPNLMETGSTTPAMPLQVARAVRADMVDYEKGTITFNNFDQMKLLGGSSNVQSTNCFSPSLPVYVFLDNVEVPIDWSTWGPTMALWRKANPTQKPPVTGDSVDLSGWNNLLWFYVVPAHKVTVIVDGKPTVVEEPCKGIHSSPVVIGNNVYFVCDDGYLYCYPTEPGENSGGPADPKLLVWEGKISEDPGVAPSSGSNLSIAGSNGVLLVPTPQGLHAYTNATTLVADSNRLVEADGAGEIRWSLSSISWPVSAPKSSTPAVTSGPINKPTRARYLPSGEILLVNSAANQVCRIDKSGTAGLGGLAGKSIRGVYDRFVDPKSLLRPGQPTSLSAPTDAVFWQDYEKQADGTTLRIDHCVIADSSNHRIVDLVYRFNLENYVAVSLATTDRPGEQPDPSTGFYLPELNWVTVTDSTNERYVYDCIQLVPGVITNSDNTTQPCEDIYAAASNYRGNLPAAPPPKVTTEGLGGAIFALRYRVPVSGGASWNYSAANSGRIVAACDRVRLNPSADAPVVPLACPRFFQVIDRPPKLPTLVCKRVILICDNYGVYEVGPVLAGSNPPITRQFRDEDYRNIKREMKYFGGAGIAGERELLVPLVASTVQELKNSNCVQELGNGNWLITNSYSGSSTTGAKSFSGEVFEISWNETPPGSGLYTLGRVEWCSPGLYVLPDASDPTIPDWSTWKQWLENGYIFQQPRSAIRQM